MLSCSHLLNFVIDVVRLKASTNIKRCKFNNGFTLIELMIGIAVLGILLAVATPSFRDWLQNTKTRTVAEALQAGVRSAQVEALRNGLPVQFFLTDDAPPVLGSATSATGRNWGIRTMSTTVANTPVALIQGTVLGGTSNNVTITGSTATVTFNSIGRSVTYAAGFYTPAGSTTYAVTNTSVTNGRSYNVVASSAGAVRLCDPAKSRTTNPDGC